MYPKSSHGSNGGPSAVMVSYVSVWTVLTVGGGVDVLRQGTLNLVGRSVFFKLWRMPCFGQDLMFNWKMPKRRRKRRVWNVASFTLM